MFGTFASSISMALQSFIHDSPEWHAIRARHIGSSEVAALFGVQPDYALSAFALWQVKAGIIPPPVVENDRVNWGTRLEPVIAAGLADEQGWTIAKGRYHEDKVCPHLGASLDFEIEAPGPDDDGCEGPGILECKNVDWMIHKRSWTGSEPPLHIILQLQVQLACSGYSWGVVGALSGGNTPHVYSYHAQPKTIAAIRKRVAEFWESIENGEPPPVDGAGSTTEAIRALYPETVDESIDLRLSNEFPEACAEALSKAEERKRIVIEEEEAKNRLRLLLGSARRGYSDQYSVSVAVTPEKPDRPARVGEIIKGRAETRRLMIKERAIA
jgi:predicted phage-related endonuclease